MKVFGIYVFNCSAQTNAVQLSKAIDVSSFGYFQRGSAEEILNFVARNVASKSRETRALSVLHLDYVAYASSTTLRSATSSLADATCCVAIVITDKEYPARVAASLAIQALRSFTDLYTQMTPAAVAPWSAVAADSLLFPSEFGALLVRAQQPEQVDDIEQIRKDLDQTQDALHKTIKDLLVRGEKLDDLAEQSDDLGVFSREFVKKSESLNQCCLLL